MTEWEKYQEEQRRQGKIEIKRSARPWDLFNAKIGRVPEDIQKIRYNICKDCPYFISLTTQCKICKCFMKEKTKLPNASCPMHYWEQYNGVDDNGVL